MNLRLWDPRGRVCLSHCSGHLVGFFHFGMLAEVSQTRSHVIWVYWAVTQHLIWFSFCLYMCFFISFSVFLWLFPSLLLSLVFLALFHWPVSWLDNANTLFITLHSFSGLYGMPSNQAIVSYGARELITRHRTSVKAISYETWHALKSVEAERTSRFHRLMLLWSSCTCTKSPCCNVEFSLLGSLGCVIVFYILEANGLPAHSLPNSQAKKDRI